jgi:hypothetical protein
MEFISTSRNYSHRNSYNENRLLNIFCTQKLNNDTPTANNFTYRTEVYLQQREKQNMNKSLPATITTWKNLKYQKRILDNDQAEIDRALSTIDSIHGTFNRSLLIPSNQVYSSLYGDDDKSIRLMKIFCRRQDHYMSCDLPMKDDDDSNTQKLSTSFGKFQDTDFDDDTEDEEEKENENEKKCSYDSGYGSVMPMKHLSREPLLKITQPLSRN